MKLPKTFEPTSILSKAGYTKTGFLKVGTGPWTGTVTINGHDYTVDEMPRSWRITTPSGVNVTGPDLVTVLKAAERENR